MNIALSPEHHPLALYHAVGPLEIAALVRSDWRRIESARDGEPFLYLKVQQRYAEMIARQSRVPAHGIGYVLQLLLPPGLMRQYDLDTVAYDEHLEYCVPSLELDMLNAHLLAPIRVVAVFTPHESFTVPAGRPLSGAFIR